MVEEGRMWKVGDGSARARAWLECMTQEETVSLAWDEHNTGHFHRDWIETLLDEIVRSTIDQCIIKAIMDCGRRRGLGSTRLHSLLELVTSRHLFELVVADTLSMPKGKGGITNLGCGLTFIRSGRGLRS